MSRPIHVLYVDDNPAALRFRAELLNEFEDITVRTAEGVSTGLELLDASEFDCVLSDLDMSSRDGLDFLHAVRARHPDLPFILFTSTQPRAAVEEALEADVTDYIVKRDVDGFQEVLVNRIRQFVAHYQAKQRLGEIGAKSGGAPDTGE